MTERIWRPGACGLPFLYRSSATVEQETRTSGDEQLEEGGAHDGRGGSVLSVVFIIRGVEVGGRDEVHR